MKRIAKMSAVLALVLVLILPVVMIPAFSISAQAEDVQVEGVLNLYVNKDKLKIFEKKRTDSKVLKKVKGGKQLLIELKSADGKWYGTLVEDTKHGGQVMGWVQAKYMSETIPIEFCDHNWSDWTVVKEPNCTKKGLKTRQCSICGGIEEKKIKELGHDYDEWEVTEEATCYKAGKRYRICYTCDYKDEEEFYLPHTFGDWTVLRASTCAVEGERVHTCRVCGYDEKKAIDKIPHDFEWKVTVEATDHSSGTRAKVCRNCGNTAGEESYDPEGTLRRGARGDAVRNLQQQLVDQGYLNAGGADGVYGGGTEKAVMQFQQDQRLNPDGIAWPQTLKRLNHVFGPWETVREMTRNEPGERVRICVDCGYRQRETIEPGTVFEKGRRGEDVRAMQQIIKEVGYNAGTCDGIYGRKLDAAMAAFAADRGLVVEEGRIRPADVDALVNAWFGQIPSDNWKGEGNMASAVNLALSVTPMGDENADSAITTYSWTLTNLGSEKAMFNTLLLTFGENANFKRDNLVMVLDGAELKPNAANSISGSFTASMDWGEGSLNFAAMAVHEKTGNKWLSNTVVFENEATAPRTIEPMSTGINVNALSDGVYPVSFNRGDILSGASGIFMNAVHIFTMDTYDIVDIEGLKIGDTIVVGGESYEVSTVENDEGRVFINGGIDKPNGHELATVADGSCYRVVMYDDLATYTERGVTTLTLDLSAVYTDAWNIESDPVTANYNRIVDAMMESDNDYFDPYSTTIRIESGKVVEINRQYVP